MDERIFNFSAGPAILPEPVLEHARAEMLSFRGSGMSVMELSHRSRLFGDVLEGARNGLRELLSIPDEYEVLFLQGGATLQFTTVPANFLTKGRTAEYIVTGAWGEKAVAEAKRYGNASVIISTETSGYSTIPQPSDINIDPDAAYVHYTSNETIDGVEFPADLDGGGVPVICDASSDILSKPVDVSKYALIYAGAQKNIGPSGVTVVIIRRDLLEMSNPELPALWNYKKLADADSMLNTPNTWGIYIIGLVCEWLASQGGVAAIAEKNRAKAALLYEAIDSSDGYYTGKAARDARSLMNVTFNLRSEELAATFAKAAASIGLDGLKGHRSAGGIRASIYNAFPREGVEKLVEFMKAFASDNP